MAPPVSGVLVPALEDAAEVEASRVSPALDPPWVEAVPPAVDPTVSSIGDGPSAVPSAEEGPYVVAFVDPSSPQPTATITTVGAIHPSQCVFIVPS
jgi:hypothetical protein